MELRRVAAASAFVSFPMVTLGGITTSGLTVTGTWAAWADTAGLTSQGNPGFRTLTGLFPEIAATGVYGGFLAETELPAASPYVMLRFIGTNAATQYLLITTASAFANVQAVTAGAITSAAFASGAITAGVIAADAIGASELATDAVAEIADAVWDEVILSAHTADNTTGLMAARLYHATQYLDAAVSTRSAPGTGQTVDVVDTGAITSTSFAAGAIDASAIAANAIGASEIADGAIDAGAIATGAIDADALAADAVAEIADGVWDEVILSAHTTDNTTGKAIGRLYHATDYLNTSILAIGSTYADDLLGRTVSGGASGGRTVADAMAAIRNRVNILAGTLTVYETDDSTARWTAAIATQAVSAVVTDINPA